MGRILISLLAVVLVLNAMTFLLVAFQEGPEESAAEVDSGPDPAIQGLVRQVGEIKKKVDDLSRQRTSSAQLTRKLDALTKKLDTIQRQLDEAFAAEPEPEPELEPEPVEDDGGAGEDA